MEQIKYLKYDTGDLVYVFNDNKLYQAKITYVEVILFSDDKKEHILQKTGYRVVFFKNSKTNKYYPEDEVFRTIEEARSNVKIENYV